MRIAVAHALGLLETSSKWDLRSTLIVRFVRSLLAKDSPASVSVQQAGSLRDPGVQGPVWVSKVTLPAPGERDVLDRLVAAIEDAKSPGAVYDVPAIEPVQAEWTGFRKGADARTKPLADLSDAQVYSKMMEEATSETTILYMHGGALYLMDPASHRQICASLARFTGGRCLSVRYRLAPKYPFPAALLDCLLAYLYLLHPPPGSHHKPVPASKIVFSGDSAGGTLSFALLQLILHLHRMAPSGQTPTIRFHAEDVPLPVPAGVACASAWLDLTMSLPSLFDNAKWDYLPSPRDSSIVERYPACALWPTDPVREELYCDVSMLMHPLVSPLAAKSSAWRGSCPISLQYGQEVLSDEGKVMCRRLVQEGVHVQWDEFEGVPHVWHLMFFGRESSKKAIRIWADFIARVTSGEAIETKGTFYGAKTLKEKKVDINALTELSDSQVEEKMRATVKRKEAYGAKRDQAALKAKL